MKAISCLASNITTRLRQGVAGIMTCMALLVSADHLTAQGTFQAISFNLPGVAGYTANGVGWSFVPNSDLLVTGISATAPQVSFWQGESQLLAAYIYAGPYGSLVTGPSTNFQSIQPLLLSAGQKYFISAQSSNFATSTALFVYSRNGAGSPPPYGPPPFATSSDIIDFASYYLYPNGQWSSPVTPASDNINYALLGPNFQYQVVPEPSSFGLVVISAALCGFRRRMSLTR